MEAQHGPASFHSRGHRRCAWHLRRLRTRTIGSARQRGARFRERKPGDFRERRTSFATLAEVRLFNLQSVSDAFDKNHNGFLCAYEARGTRAWNNDPLIDYTWFGVSDDKDR